MKITRGGKDCGKVKVDVKRIGYSAPVEKPKSPVIEVKIAPEKKDEAPAKEEGRSWVTWILFLGVVAAGGAAFAKHKKMF